MCERRPLFVPATCQCGVHWGQIMDASIHRRVSISTYWASTRIAFLDGIESYEDSYALTQEFREWITCVGEHPEHFQDSVLKLPKRFQSSFNQEKRDTDEVVEI